ncbi:DUF3093 domain-containing protein [Mycobacterium sp. WMMD1722]|uniref:DUF3093 domain-containing protein n=1 Tax=Mycobacterium sp. WMMD1722 TaxID=3404117 RepID=UPI003BF4B804
MTADAPPVERLFYEPGASWAWLLAGPAAAAAMLAIQISAGYGLQPLVPVLFLVLVSGFLAVQVKAARIHTSVELTPLTLRQGAEIIKVADIVSLYPPAGGSEVQKWESARALGELTGVPRGRKGIGLALTGKRTAQAWARRHRDLREQLERLVTERTA